MLFRLVGLLTLAIWLALNVIGCADDDDFNASHAPAIVAVDNQDPGDDVNDFRLLSFVTLPAVSYLNFPESAIVRCIEKVPGIVAIDRRPFEMTCSFLL